MGRKNTQAEQESRQRPRRGCFGRLLMFLIVLEGILLAIGIGAFFGVNALYDKVPQIQNETAELLDNLEQWGKKILKKDDGIINILLIGQDMREEENHKLSDAMILCSFDKNRSTLTMCSLMRDMYVQLPDYAGHTGGMNRINAAYALGYQWSGEYGGMEMLDKLIQEQFGVEVDCNVGFSFDSFVEVVDALGGVEIDLTGEEAAFLNGQPQLRGNLTEGSNLLNGETALAYARTRHSSATDSDFSRTGRQRNLISAVFQKCRGMGALELGKLAEQLLPLIRTDMTKGQMVSIAVKLLPVLRSLELKSKQIPAPGTYENARVEIGGVGAAVLIPDMEENRRILTEICEGN